MTMIDFRTQIRGEMIRLGWSGAELARRAKMQASQVTEWLAGRKTITVDSLEQILAAIWAADPANAPQRIA